MKILRADIIHLWESVIVEIIIRIKLWHKNSQLSVKHLDFVSIYTDSEGDKEGDDWSLNFYKDWRRMNVWMFVIHVFKKGIFIQFVP